MGQITRMPRSVMAAIVALVLIASATLPVVLIYTGPMMRDMLVMSRTAPVWARWEAMRLVDNACVVQDWYWTHVRGAQ
jgi:hypothetical protein